MLKVSDALMRVSRTIRDRRRRAGENGSDERWWPALNHELNEKYIVPLMDELAAFHPKGGYDRDAAMAPLREASATLINLKDEAPLPSIKTDGQLIEAHLEPAIALLCDRRAEDASRDGLMHEILRCKPRERFKNEAGRDLVSCLENLVASEPRSVPQMRTTDDISMLGMPGMVVEMSREEAEAWGFCEENSLSEEDAWESQADLVSYSAVKLTGLKLGWYECDTQAKAILFAATFLQQRMEERAPSRNEQKLRRSHFCELCDELAAPARHDDKPTASVRENQPFCRLHMNSRSRSGKSPGEISWFVSTVLQEASKDPGYKRRFLVDSDGHQLLGEILDHTNACDFCSGRALQPKCLDPSKRYFAGLMAFHANVRKVAYKLANSHYNSVAWMIDRAVQDGRSAKEFMGYYRLDTEKAIGQYSGLALARLLFQRVSGVEIATRLGVSPSAVSQRRAALTGCFDFAPRRNPSLIWWPFDDIVGDNVLKFPSRALGDEWRHSSSEYRRLASSRKNT